MPGAALRDLSVAELGVIQERVTRTFSTEGSTFTVYGDDEADERIIPVDCVPRVISGSHWQHVETGLTQRLKAINLFLADVYGEGRIIEDGVIPVDVVRGCPSTPRALPESLAMDAWTEMRPWAESSADWEFTHASAFARPSPELEAFSRLEDLMAPTGDPLSALSALAGALHRIFEYLPGSTSAVSPIEQILESGVGVCQDYAHVMIAIARSWGVPSRYVSGYLHVADPPDQPTRAEASHAWVECRLPDLGWVGFDPTNPGLARELYVRIAVGRDYGDVSPVRGIFRGSADARLTVAVMIGPVSRD